jgi:hypothetical protein
MQSKQQKLSKNSFFIVRVPALNLVFLGYYLKKKLMLSPIENAHNYKFIVGFPMLASDVLIKFRLAAKNHNNLPRYFFIRDLLVLS